MLVLICLVIIILSITGIITAINWLKEADSLWTWIGAGLFTLFILTASGVSCWFFIGCNLPGQDRSLAPPLWTAFIPTALFSLYWICLFGRAILDLGLDRYEAYLDKKEDEEERLRLEAKKAIDSMFHYMDQLLDRSQPFGADQAATVGIICEKLGLPPRLAYLLISVHTRPKD